MATLFTNIGDPDQMLHIVASDLGLPCLPITLFGVSRLIPVLSIVYYGTNRMICEYIYDYKTN